MSSFNIYDNYSSFSDLINRTEFLEEKTYKSMVKGANLGPELKKYRTEDGKGLSATSRVKNLILISALVRMDMLDEDVAKALRKKATSSTYITNTLKELAPKVHAELFDGDNPGSEKVVKYVQDNIKELLPFAVKNVTRGEFEIKEVDTEEPDDSEAKELEDEVSDEVKIAQGLMSSGADQVELDFDDLDVNIEALDNKEQVAAKIVELINTTNNLKAEVTPIGFNVEGPVGIFRAKKDAKGNIILTGEEVARDQMNRLITKYFPAVSESEIKVTLNTNEEDYEYQEGQGITEPEETNEYAEGEEGDGITEVEDAEDLSAKKARAGKDIGKPGKNFEKISDKAAKKYGSKKAGDRVAGAILAKMRGNYEGEEDGITQKPYISIYTDDDGRKVYDVLDKHGKSAYKSYYKKVAEHWLREYYDIMMREDEEDNELDHFLTKEQPEDYIPSTDYEDVLDALVDDDKKKHAMKKLNGEDEEGDTLSKIERDISNGMTAKESMDSLGIHPSRQKDMLRKYLAYTDKYSEGPIETGFEDTEKLQVESTTAAYLTEQKQSDKRNKKTKVKNQSFKERYKPKTHWQLEELRRYGL